MTRLVDADALLKTLTVFDEKYTLQKSDVFHHIENAPTVQREDAMEVIKAVAHIGIDFGYGKYELEQDKIDLARKIYEAAPKE